MREVFYSLPTAQPALAILSGSKDERAGSICGYNLTLIIRAEQKHGHETGNGSSVTMKGIHDANKSRKGKDRAKSKKH